MNTSSIYKEFTRFKATTLSMSFFLFLVAPCTWAQPGNQSKNSVGSPAGENGNNVSFKFQIYGQAWADADFDNDNGNVGLSRVGADLEAAIQINSRWQLSFEGSLEQSTYDFEPVNSESLLNNSWFEDFDRQSLSIRSLYVHSPRIISFLGVGGSAGVDQSASVNDAFLLQADAGVIWRKSDQFSWIFGAFFQEEFDGDDQVLPYIGFQWNFRENWDFHLGPDLGLTYQHRSQWQFSLSASYEQRDFKLANQAPLSDGSLEDNRIQTSFSAAWQPSKHFQLELSGGLNLHQEFELKSRSGHLVAQEETEPHGFSRVAFTFQF